MNARLCREHGSCLAKPGDGLVEDEGDVILGADVANHALVPAGRCVRVRACVCVCVCVCERSSRKACLCARM